jgi:ABC-type sugar transport system ATPase subunit
VSGPQREDLARRGVSVRLRGVGKSFVDGARSIEVLHDIDLDLAPGELTAIVGPSGSGKSTLLHVIGGLERADRGEIEVDGRRWDQFDERRLAAERSRTLGFVFQFHQLLPDFTAVENVALPGRIAGRPAAGGPGRGALRSGSGRSAEPLSERAFGRRASARGAVSRLVPRAAAPARRRADGKSRPGGGGGGVRIVPRPARTARHHHRPGDAQSRSGPALCYHPTARRRSVGADNLRFRIGLSVVARIR